MTEELTIEMSWTAAVPMLVEIIANGNPAGRRDAKDELMKLARMGDAYRKLVKVLREPSAEMLLSGALALSNCEGGPPSHTAANAVFTAMVNEVLPSPEPAGA